MLAWWRGGGGEAGAVYLAPLGPSTTLRVVPLPCKCRGGVNGYYPSISSNSLPLVSLMNFWTRKKLIVAPIA